MFNLHKVVVNEHFRFSIVIFFEIKKTFVKTCSYVVVPSRVSEIGTWIASQAQV